MYKFPLGSVLKHRKTVEEGHQKELSLLINSLTDELKKIEELNDAREKASKELKIKQKKGVTASEAMLYFRFVEQLTEMLKIQEQRVLEVEREVDEKREELTAAMKNRKILENLKERGLERYRETLNKKELEFMNEMSSVRFKLKPEE